MNKKGVEHRALTFSSQKTLYHQQILKIVIWNHKTKFVSDCNKNIDLINENRLYTNNVTLTVFDLESY